LVRTILPALALTIICAVIVATTAIAAPVPAVGCMDSDFMGESAFLSLQPGDSGSFFVTFMNTGTCSWIKGTSSQVDLAQGLPLGSPSPNSCWGVGWLSATAYATTTQAVVAPGGLASFTFGLKAPPNVPPGTYRFDGDLVVSATGQPIHPVGYYQQVTVPLASQGTIGGKVTALATGAGVANTNVEAFDSIALGNGVPMILTAQLTDACGYYTLKLPAGTYRTGYIPPSGANVYFQYYKNALTVYAGNDLTVGTTGHTLADVALSPIRTISGKALAASGAGVPGVFVLLRDPNASCPSIPGGCGNFTGAMTDPTGAYSLQVPIGRFTLLFLPTSGSSHAIEIYRNKDDWISADQVDTTAGSQSGIDLTFRGAISGRVTTPAGSPQPYFTVQVNQAIGASCSLLRALSTDANGYYAVPFGVPSPAPLNLKVQFIPSATAAPKWWNNKADCSTADVIPWTGVDVTGVNAILP
jgi:hypothetical protein